MHFFYSIRQLLNGKECDIAKSNKLSKSSSSESSPIVSASERNVEDEPEVHVRTQDEVNEQIRNYIAPLTKQLEDLTRLI